MEIIGTIDKILDKSNPPLKKSIVVIKDTENLKNTWCVEFRKNLSDIATFLIPGDCIKVLVYNDGRVDKYNNCYNNLVAEKIIRL